jgi:hypothetical protein
MADKKISALTAASTPLAGTEVLPIVQSGSTVKVSVDNLTTGKTVAMNQINLENSTVGFPTLGTASGSLRLLGSGGGGFGLFGGLDGGTGRSWLQAMRTDGPTAYDLRLQPVGGNVRIGTGDVIIETAGKGIDFSANANAAGMTSELLNDYEEGTWTPTDGSGAGLSFANTANNCFYTKIGRMVVCVFGLSYPSTADVSSAALLGLPFTSKSSASNVAGGYTTYTDAGIQIQLLVGNNDTSVTLWKNTGSAVTNVELSGKWLRGVITYFV